MISGSEVAAQDRLWVSIILTMGMPFLGQIAAMADFPKKTPADWEKLAAKELRDKPLSSLDWMTPRASR